MGMFPLHLFSGPRRNPSPSQRQDASPNPVDHRSQLYKHYLEKAEEYDRDFIKKRDEDLNLTLVPVSSANCATEHVLIRGRLVCTPL